MIWPTGKSKGVETKSILSEHVKCYLLRRSFFLCWWPNDVQPDKNLDTFFPSYIYKMPFLLSFHKLHSQSKLCWGGVYKTCCESSSSQLQWFSQGPRQKPLLPLNPEKTSIWLGWYDQTVALITTWYLPCLYEEVSEPYRWRWSRSSCWRCSSPSWTRRTSSSCHLRLELSLTPQIVMAMLENANHWWYLAAAPGCGSPVCTGRQIFGPARTSPCFKKISSCKK